MFISPHVGMIWAQGGGKTTHQTGNQQLPSRPSLPVTRIHRFRTALSETRAPLNVISQAKKLARVASPTFRHFHAAISLTYLPF